MKTYESYLLCFSSVFTTGIMQSGWEETNQNLNAAHFN